MLFANLKMGMLATQNIPQIHFCATQTRDCEGKGDFNKQDFTAREDNVPINVKSMPGRSGIGGAFELGQEFLFNFPTPGQTLLIR